MSPTSVNPAFAADEAAENAALAGLLNQPAAFIADVLGTAADLAALYIEDGEPVPEHLLAEITGALRAGPVTIARAASVHAGQRRDRADLATLANVPRPLDGDQAEADWLTRKAEIAAELASLSRPRAAYAYALDSKPEEVAAA